MEFGVPSQKMQTEKGTLKQTDPSTLTFPSLLVCVISSFLFLCRSIIVAGCAKSIELIAERLRDQSTLLIGAPVVCTRGLALLMNRSVVIILQDLMIRSFVGGESFEKVALRDRVDIH